MQLLLQPAISGGRYMLKTDCYEYAWFGVGIIVGLVAALIVKYIKDNS